MAGSSPLSELIDQAPELSWLDAAACADLELAQLSLFFVEAGRTIAPDTKALCRQVQDRRAGPVGGKVSAFAQETQAPHQVADAVPSPRPDPVQRLLVVAVVDFAVPDGAPADDAALAHKKIAGA